MLAKIIEGKSHRQGKQPSVEDVLSGWLTEYKPVVKHLSTAIGKGGIMYVTVLYEERRKQAERVRGPELPGEAPTCPCGSKMVRRARKADGVPFWGCTRFPECTVVVNFDEADKEAERRRQSPDEPEFGGQGGYDDSDTDDIPF